MHYKKAWGYATQQQTIQVRCACKNRVVHILYLLPQKAQNAHIWNNWYSFLTRTSQIARKIILQSDRFNRMRHRKRTFSTNISIINALCLNKIPIYETVNGAVFANPRCASVVSFSGVFSHTSSISNIFLDNQHSKSSTPSISINVVVNVSPTKLLWTNWKQS